MVRRLALAGWTSGLFFDIANSCNLNPTFRKCKKTTEKCVKFICKKLCEMREIHMQKTDRHARWISRFFLHRNLAHFQRFFFSKICKKMYANFLYFSSFFVMIFYWTVCRDGKSGIPVKSRSICGNPDRDCTENTRFYSAMSTKSEIVKIIPEKPLTARSNRNPPV